MSCTVAALLQLSPATRGRTSTDADFGRAARALAGRGVRVVVAAPDGLRFEPGRVTVEGFAPGDDGWVASGPHPLDAVFLRLPARALEQARRLDARLARRGIPLGNPPGINALALDKAASLARLAAAGLPVPAIETDPGRFAARLAGWGAGFLKPRFGSFGAGVRRVVAGDPLPADGAGDGDGDEDGDAPAAGPPLLQRAIDPPGGPFRGVCVRGFLQRDAGGRWRSAGRVARVSADDPVANVARGARGVPVAELVAALPVAAGLEERLDTLEARVAAALEARAGDAAARLLEFGTDWVIDGAGAPHLVEINGKPGGRLRILAERPGADGERWRARHLDALTAPFVRLAGLAGYQITSGPVDV